MEQDQFKRHIAFKIRIGDILEGRVIMDGEKFKCIEHGTKQVARVNLVANVIEKFVQDGERKFGSITLDDASGQIKVKVFGDDIALLEPFEQGDTLMCIGLLRSWNNEVYLTPDILKKKEPQYLLVRKYELDLEQPKELPKEEQSDLKNKILETVKKSEDDGGAEVEDMIMALKSSPEAINTEIKKLLEEGIIYEPRPGKIRYLG